MKYDRCETKVDLWDELYGEGETYGRGPQRQMRMKRMQIFFIFTKSCSQSK
jgi:hypothetical protein